MSYGNWVGRWHRGAGIVLVVLCGCGASDEERPSLQPTTGALFINGKPAAGALLVLHPANGADFDARGTRPRATVEADGTFHVSTYQGGDGAPAGDYQVAVMWFDDPDSSSPWDMLSNRYSNPRQTGIRISVREGESQLEPIRLEGVRLTSRPRRQTPADYDQVD